MLDQNDIKTPFLLFSSVSGSREALIQYRQSFSDRYGQKPQIKQAAASAYVRRR
jgi:hypothetical protein